MLKAHDDLFSSLLRRRIEKKDSDRVSNGSTRAPASSRRSLSIIAAFLPILLAASLLAQTDQTAQKQNIVFRVVITIIRTAVPLRPATPSFTPAAGAYLRGQQIVLADNTSGAIIHYTVDGSAPSPNSPIYSAPLVLSADEVIQAIGVVANTSSPASSTTYRVLLPHLVFSTQPKPTMSNVTLNPAPTVSILDGNDHLISDATNAVTLSLSANPGKAVLRGTTTVTAVHGVAHFKDLIISNGGSGYTLGAVSNGMTPATSAAFDLRSPSITISLPSFSVAVGNTVTGTITLGQPAGAQDVHLSLTSSLVNVASVAPSSVAVQAGQSAGHFTLTGIGAGTSTLNAASAGYNSDTAQVTTLPAAPVIKPTSGSYASGQQVTMTDVVPAAAIYYTTDGSIPTTSSPLYSGPITLSRAQVVQAVAVQSSLNSSVTSQAYQILPAYMTVSPTSATLSASQTQSFIASLTGLSDTTVTWSLSPVIGSVSQGGLYTAPASITTSQTVAITATSKADPTRTVTAKVSLVPPVSLSISPGSVSLASSQTQSFAAQVNGTSNAAVTWSLNPAIGNISVSGLYTAPATIPNAQIVTITASSVADPTKTSTANVALVPPVAITLTPGKVSLSPSQTQMFSLSVSGSSNTAVIWSLSPSLGAISPSGLYTAPSSVTVAQIVTVTATSLADPTKTATASVALVPPVGITLTPGALSLSTSQTQIFIVTVSGTSNTAVTWSLSPSIGAISPSALYTAPSSVTAAQIVTVTATSVADPTRTATAKVSLVPPVSVSLVPGSAMLSASQTQSFAATVTGSSNIGATYALSPAVGSISPSGLYTAPSFVAIAQNVTVTATSVADPTKTATANVSLVPPVGITLTPAALSLSPSQTQIFTAMVSGTSNTAVIWSLSPSLGAISPSGLYTAPSSVATAQIVTVTATSVADPTKTATAKASLIPPVSVSLTPGSAVLTASQTQSFAATVTGSPNIGVTYAVRPAVGSISASGLYTAPASVAMAQTISVVATSVADATQSATASVTLAPTPTLALSLLASSSSIGSTQTGSVALSQPAGTGGVSVTLASNSPSIAMPSAPSLTIAAGQSTGSFTYTALAAGTAIFTAGANGYSSATVQVTVAPPAIPASLFGLTVLNFQNISPGLQFGTTRSWDAYYFAGLDWADINTAPGVYNFFSLDQFIQLNQSRGADILYTFGRTPQWASSQPNAAGSYGTGQCAPPSDMTAWDNFVTAIVTHAAGKIRYWELWNEPDSTPMYCGDIPTMVTMAKHASAIIKKLDPTALLLSPGVTGGPGPAWLSTFLADGGSSAVDVIGFHGYWSANAEDLLSVISSYKAAMQSNGATAKPMWDTEGSWGGFGNIGTPSTSQQVGFVAKYYLLHWSQGVSRFIWFAFDAESTPWGDLWSSTAGTTSAAVAYGETYKWMVGASLTAPCSKATNGTWTCNLTRPGGYQAEAVWISNSSASYTVDPKYKEYRDLSGVVHPVVGGKITASDQPVLLESGSIQ